MIQYASSKMRTHGTRTEMNNLLYKQNCKINTCKSVLLKMLTDTMRAGHGTMYVYI